MMDFLLNDLLLHDNCFFDSSLLAFLKQTGWAYYTIWKADAPHHLVLPGLTWSRGQVNESLVADDENNLSKDCRSMGLLLQAFYKQCSFLPLGSGSMAGKAFASGQCQWASGEELLMQMRFLSHQNQKPAPPGLQALYFETVVCIPLQNRTGVLEMGTNKLVPESDGMLSQILRFIDGLSTQGDSRAEPIISSSFEGDTKTLPNDAENQYGDLEEQYKSVSMMEKFGSRDTFQRSSLPSSYWSPSSTTSSSTPSASDQMGNSSNTAILPLNTINNDDRPLSLASYLQTTPNSMHDRFCELGILQHLDHFDMHDVNTLISVQEFDGYQLSDAEFIAPSHEQHLHLSNHQHYFSSRDVIGTSTLPSLLDIPHYACSGGNAATGSLVDCELQPIECAYSGTDERVDAHHCLNEIVEGPSRKSYIEDQTSWCDELPVASISCLPSAVTCQGASQSASNGVTEVAEGMTDLFGQSEQHSTHAMVTTVISETPLAEYSFAGKRLEADLHPKIVALVQDAALLIENEASTGQNSKMVASLTLPSTTQAAGSYVSYTSGSAEAEKAVGSSLAAEGSSIRYEFGAVHEDYKIERGSSRSQLDAAGRSYASYASGSAESPKEAGLLRSQAAGGYASYVSSSAEAGKVDGSSTGFLSRQGAGSLIGSGTRDDPYRAQQNGEFLDGLQQALQGLQDDRYMASANYCTNIGTLQESNLNFASGVQSDPAIHHMHAERERRRKESHCIDTLRTLVNVPNISKKHPKVAILESTIQYLKELKARIYELEQENVSLINLKLKSKNNSTKDFRNFVSNLEHATDVKSSIQSKVSNKSAIGHCIYCSSVEATIPYFQLILTKNIQDIKDDATIIRILNSLQTKNLYCYEINYEFFKNTNKLFINILANYKDGENQSPSLDEIQGIKEWWNYLIKY